MRSASEVSSLIEGLKAADQHRIEAHASFASLLKELQAVLREKAEAIISGLKAADTAPTVLRTRSMSIIGWVLVHHPSKQEPLKWPMRSDGFMLVVDSSWTFWLVERGPAWQNPEIEVTTNIMECRLDSDFWINHVWEIIKDIP